MTVYVKKKSRFTIQYVKPAAQSYNQISSKTTQENMGKYITGIYYWRAEMRKVLTANSR